MAFWPYRSVQSQASAHVDAQLRKFNRQVAQWEEYWHDYYQRLGQRSDHFLVQELASQKAYAILFTNSVAWWGVHTRNDVLRLSPERRQWLAAAMRSAAFLISSLGSGPQEKGSEFANHFFQVGLVAVTRYLLRMVEFLPEVCDRYTISLDIDKLLLKMPSYPRHPFTPLMTRTITRARERGVIPYTSISEEAARAGVQAYQASPSSAGQQHEGGIMGAESLPLGLNPLPWAQGDDGSGAAAADGALGGVAWPNDLNLASWFPTDDMGVAAMGTDSSFTDLSTWFPIQA